MHYQASALPFASPIACKMICFRTRVGQPRFATRRQSRSQSPRAFLVTLSAWRLGRTQPLGTRLWATGEEKWLCCNLRSGSIFVWLGKPIPAETRNDGLTGSRDHVNHKVSGSTKWLPEMERA